MQYFYTNYLSPKGVLTNRCSYFALLYIFSVLGRAQQQCICKFLPEAQEKFDRSNIYYYFMLSLVLEHDIVKLCSRIVLFLIYVLHREYYKHKVAVLFLFNCKVTFHVLFRRNGFYSFAIFFFLLLCLKYNIEIDVLSRKQNEKPKKKKKNYF